MNRRSNVKIHKEAQYKRWNRYIRIHLLSAIQVLIHIKKKLYLMKERRLDFLGFFSGNSLILCMDALRPFCEFLRPLCEVRLVEATLSEFRLPGPSVLDCSSDSDFLERGPSDDSLSDRGFFTAFTSSDTEVVAISF